MSETQTSNRTRAQAAEADEVRPLERASEATRDDPQSTAEGRGNSDEEPKASNEAIVSMAEELETSKEEPPSLNEEPNTVNDRLQDKAWERPRAEQVLRESERHLADDLTNMTRLQQVST